MIEEYKHYELNETLSRELSEKLKINSLKVRQDLGIIQPGECFTDAVKVISYIKGLDNVFYCEGYAASGRLGIPLEHAFALYNNQVIDVTWVEDGSMSGNIYKPILKLNKLDFVRLCKKTDGVMPLMMEYARELTSEQRQEFNQSLMNCMLSFFK